MKARMDQDELYDTGLFPSWSVREQLIIHEKYLFNKYIYPQPRTAKILDIGTGNGRFLFVLNQQGFSHCTGIDISKKLLSVGQQRAQRQHLPINFVLADATHLALKSEQFDIVLALQQVICLIARKELRKQAITQFSQVLKPGGLLLISFMHFPGRGINKIVSPLLLPLKLLKGDFNFLHPRFLPYLTLGKKVNFKFIFEKQPYNYWYYTDEVLDIFKDTGLKVKEYLTGRMIEENRSDLVHGGQLFIAAVKE
jgi:ubiquinone/menaquinone biosynthesis C-methylase UbiE